MKLRDLPIQRKLLRINMLTCAVVLTLMAITYMAFEYYSFRKTVQDSVTTMARVVGLNSCAALAFDSPKDAAEILSALKADPNIKAGCIYTMEGNIFAKYPANVSATVFPAPVYEHKYRFTTRFIEVFQPVIQGKNQLGVLFIKSDLERLYAQLRHYALIGFLLLIGSLIVAYFFSSILQRSISEPIKTLENTARVISEQRDYSVRATQYGKDELGALTLAFNHMLTRIQSQNQEILFLNQNLEKKVSDRTHDLKEANEKLETANQNLLKSNRDLEQFAYVASHDLQEPLRKIQTFSDLMSNHLNDITKISNYQKKIHQSALRMQNLIKDVLNFSRMTKTDEAFTNVDLNIILEHVKTDFELMIREKEAVINHPVLPVIKAIPMQLAQLFSNIISNSLKYNDKKPVINIKVKKLSQVAINKVPNLNGSAYIQLEFMDNGIGFVPEYSEKIFDIFQRLHGPQAYSGTGIGLALCKKIVDNHSGIIYATGQPGKGATITIILPA